ncbi:MAG: acetylxylan esterase [Subtercola sp.]|nr:acetylxylan esterase [Subtercola sp.]
MLTDLPESDLRTYTSSQSCPDDFDEFWSHTLDEARSFAPNATVTLTPTGLSTIDTYDVRFSGFGGERVAAWLRVPAGTTEPLPTIVEFDGYGRGRGDAIQNLLWASAGFAHLEMDTRGQSWSGWTNDTPDPHGSDAHAPGMLTKGIRQRETYYYRRVYADAVRAIDAARTLPLVDPDRIGLLGTSQGGGIALAVAGLTNGIAALVARVPFLCDFPRASTITDSHPYRELADYLSVYRNDTASIHRTLAYFDGVNFAARATAPARFTVGLMDSVCPPSTVFAAHNAYRGERQLTVWPYNGHEGGGVVDDLSALATFRELL